MAQILVEWNHQKTKTQDRVHADLGFPVAALHNVAGNHIELTSLYSTIIQ